MCISPLILRNKTTKGGSNTFTQPVPCGKCPKCVKSKIHNWQFRLDQERKRSTSALFVTLTYSDENLTYSDAGPTLVKKDFQNFMKRLRKLTPNKLKYYAVGEYGSKTHRPHYHAIIFNLHEPKLIQNAWGLGFTYSPPLSSGGISYVLKYISKPRQQITDKQPEFSLMSQGMGANYMTPQVVKFHKSSPAHAYVVENGYKKSLPRYYKKKMFTESEYNATTLYNKKRSKALEISQLKKAIGKHRTKNVKEVLNMLDIRNRNHTFDIRQNEVL